MDPLSSAATITTLAAILYRTSIGLYSFIEGTRLVDERVTELYEETQSLARMVNTVQTTIDDPVLRSLGPDELWVRVKACLIQCQTTMIAFQRIVDSVEARRRSNPLRDAVRYFKLVLSDEDVIRLKSQLHTHCQTLSLIVQTLNLHMSAAAVQAGQAATAASTSLVSTLDPRFDELQARLSEVLLAIQNINTTNVTAIDPGTVQADEQLRIAANAVASRASQILGTRTTVWGGSATRSHGSQQGVRSVTTGSELGDPLSIDNIHHISNWASQAAAPESEIAELPAADVPPPSTVAASQVPSSVFDTQSQYHQPSRTQTSNTVASTIVDHEEYSDDDDTEVELVERHLLNARQNSESGNYDVAERFYRKALDKRQQLSRAKREQFDERSLKQELATLYFHQDKLDEAQILCLEVIREALLGEADKRHPLNASHLLAQIKLRGGNFDEAKTECKKAMVGCRRLDGKTQPYYESLALMAFIFEQSGDDEDTIEAESYQGLLPPNFTKPDFKGPMATPPATGNSRAASTVETPSTEPHTEDPTFDLNMSMPRPPSLASSGLENLVTTRDSQLGSESSHPDYAPPPYEIFNPVLASPASSQISSPAQPRRDGRSTSIPRLPLPMLPMQTISRPVGSSNASEPPHHLQENYRQSQSPASPLETRQSGYFHGRAPSSTSVSSRDDHRWPLTHDSSTSTGTHGRAPSRTDSNATSLHTPTHSQRVGSSKSTSWERITPLNGGLSTEQREVAVASLELGGFDIEDKAFSSEKALLWASEHGHPTAVILLLTGWTLMLKSSKFGIKSKGSHVVAPVDVDYFDQKGMTSLHFAARHGHLELVKLLLNARAPIQTETIKESLTPLHLAAAAGHDKVVALLIESGAIVDVLNTAGQTPFMRAVARGHMSTADILLAAGSNLFHRDAGETTTLHHAAQLESPALIRWLCTKGASLDAVDRNGRTALLHAVHFCRLENISVLIDLGADPLLADKDGDTLQHNAALEGHESIVAFCLELGFGMEMANGKGETALMLAARYGREKVVEMLLTRGANCNNVDFSGKAALNHATEERQKEVVALLKRFGAVMGVVPDRRVSVLR